MLELALSQWKIILIGVLSVLLAGSIKLYLGERDKYEAFTAQVHAQTAALQAEQNKNKAANDALITTKEKEHATEIATLNSDWGAELSRLRSSASRSTASKSVPIVTNVCDNAAADERLSSAVQKFESAIDDAISSYQTGIGRLLEDADKDAAALRQVNDWAAKERLINQ